MLCSITEKFCTIPNQQTNRRILKACKGIWKKKHSKWTEKSTSLSNQFEYTTRKAPHLCSMFKMLRQAVRRTEVACHTEPEGGLEERPEIWGQITQMETPAGFLKRISRNVMFCTRRIKV